MKIKEIKNEEAIVFDNGNKITFDHEQDCCEWNYADFEYLLDEAGIMNVEFDEDLTFEEVEESGFRFGNPGKMFFVPCYSSQNGYYTTELDIYYNNNLVIKGIDCPYDDE